MSAEFPQKQIRQVRETGFARDWIERITSTDPGTYHSIEFLFSRKK